MSLQESRGSYEYRALCDVCRDKLWASDLKLRWDGLMTCKQCWEPRHPSDFYRNRNDTHKLPFTRPDTEGELTFAAQNPIILTGIPRGNETAYSPKGVYSANSLTGKTRFTQVAYGWKESVNQFGGTSTMIVDRPLSATTSLGSSSWFLPTTPSGNGVATFSTSLGEFLGTAPITAGGLNVTAPLWTGKVGNVIFSGTYTT